MAATDTLSILDEIQAIVSDKLQVNTYKWLSRNFLVSSNVAKRLLQEFVEKHGNGLEVVYSLSGWLKNTPSTYHIRIVSSPKLAEAKQEFKENCSVQVYSVQACIPKDPAALWNSEFVQAEELFKQAHLADNCLWDNRFCGVLNSSIKWNAERTSISVSAPQVKNAGVLGMNENKITSPSVTMPQPLQQKGQKSSPKANTHFLVTVNDIKNESCEKGEQNSKLAIDNNEKSIQSLANKKVSTKNTSTGNRGTLDKMWGSATTKSKPDQFMAETDKSIPTTTEAQIHALEVLEDGTSDEDEDVKVMRRSNGEGNRKRRVVFDLSDEEEEYTNAVNLASPDPPKVKSSLGLKSSSKTIEKDKNNLNFEGTESKTMVNKGNTAVEKVSSLAIFDHVSNNVANTGDKMTDVAPKSPKRQKVLKTHINDHGRELTEVSWEGQQMETIIDGNASKKSDDKIVSDAVGRLPKAKKSPAMGCNAPVNQTGKPGNKKGANNDPKQGNILSFFKRV
nr:DNA polymerase delta subunit 3 isoform X1 [Ipomoea batatas]